MSSIPCHLVIAGRIDCKNYHAARKIAEELSQVEGNVTFEAIPMFGTDWSKFAKSKSEEFGVKHKVSPLIYYNQKNYVGSIDEFGSWASNIYNFNRSVNGVYSQSVARKEFALFLKNRKHEFCYLDVLVSNEALSKMGPVVERVVIELFDDVCPKTCENFKLLCTRESQSYNGCPFHRVVQGGWVQTGDIVDGSGGNGDTALSNANSDGTFPDESFFVKHDQLGIVSMANNGSPHTNNSQFFVTLAPLPWLDKKRVAFGRVIYGMRAFHLMEQLPRKNERPLGICKIVNCGEFLPGTPLVASKEISIANGEEETKQQQVEQKSDEEKKQQ